MSGSADQGHAAKPLRRKAYGHIMHLPGSRMGPGDHRCEEGQAIICTERLRNTHDQGFDEVFVQEKVDGSCVAVCKVGGEIIALNRAGHRAWTSPYEQHHFFAVWVQRNWDRFDALLGEGERIVGEWLALAHGTRYELHHEPFVPFDLMVEEGRVPYDTFCTRVLPHGFTIPRLIHQGGPFSVAQMLAVLEPSGHGALDPVEGAVWRVERTDTRPRGRGRHVDFLCKYVRPEKVDGCYLPDVSGRDPIWHWKP